MKCDGEPTLMISPVKMCHGVPCHGVPKRVASLLNGVDNWTVPEGHLNPLPEILPFEGISLDRCPKKVFFAAVPGVGSLNYLSFAELG